MKFDSDSPMSQQIAYWEATGNCRGMAVFLAALMLLAKQAHPNRPMDRVNVANVTPDYRMMYTHPFITPAGAQSPLRPDFEWGCPFWERRGVFLIHKSCAVLNQAALDYIK